MELTDQLRKDGTAKGLCRLWQWKLKPELNMCSLVQLYIKGIDFCISEDFPTLEFMRENFKGKCEAFGVYIDDDVAELINGPDTVLNGSCRALLTYSDFSVSRLFVRHNSEAAINVTNNAIVTIDAFDNTNLIIATAGNDAQVYVNLYGNAQAHCIGQGIILKKHNKRFY